MSEIERFFDEMEREGKGKGALQKAVEAIPEPARPPEMAIELPSPALEPPPPPSGPIATPGTLRERKRKRALRRKAAAPPAPTRAMAAEPPEPREAPAEIGDATAAPATSLSAAPEIETSPIEGAVAAPTPPTPSPAAPSAEDEVRGRVRTLLTWTIGGHEEIEPVRERCDYSFPEVNKLLGIEDAKPLLEELASKGFYSRKVVDHIPSCPNCGSLELYDKYTCPYCHKENLTKGVMLEHYACGHVDFLEKFERDGDLICPKCGKKLKLVGTDYRRIENLFVCSNCNRKFSVPDVQHVCSACNISFSYDKAELKPVYSYAFNEKMRGRVMAEYAVALPIAESLRKKGYTVSAPGMLGGKSGAVHTFDIVASKGGKNTVLSMHSAGDANQALVALFAKSLDINPERAILISLGGLNVEAKRLAQLYGIETLEGKDAEEVIGNLHRFLDAIPEGGKGHGAAVPEGKSVEEVLKKLGVTPAQIEIPSQRELPALAPEGVPLKPPPEARPVKLINVSDEVRKLRERIKGLLVNE